MPGSLIFLNFFSSSFLYMYIPKTTKFFPGKNWTQWLDFQFRNMLLHTGQLFSPHQDPGLPLQQGGALPTGPFLFVKWCICSHVSCFSFAVETKHFFAVTVNWKPARVFGLLLHMGKSCPDESQSLEMSARFHSNLAACYFMFMIESGMMIWNMDNLINLCSGFVLFIYPETGVIIPLMH